MRFSDEQQKIIDAKLDNNLISASAGSGKTTVLTARIGDEVKSGALSVDSMLVVTFTEDAASHMADKIEDKLRTLRNEAALAGDFAAEARLSSQLDLLPNAYIQTMHGFCSRVIKEKGHLLKDERLAEFTDRSCRIVSGSEQDVLLNTAVDYAIKRMYAECKSEDDPFIRFTRRFGDGRSDGVLVKIVADTYKTLRSLPNYLAECDNLIKEREKCDSEDRIMFFDELEEISKDIRDYIAQIKEIFEGSDFASVLDAHPKYKIVKDLSNDEFLSIVSDRLGKAISDYETNKGIDFFACLKPVMELGEFSYSSMFRNPDLAGDDSAILALVSLRRFVDSDSMKDSKYNNRYDLPKEYAKLLSFEKEQVLTNQKIGTEACRSFVELLKMTDDEYLDIKNRMHCMDYSDLEHTALAILKEDEAKAFYKEKFVEIFVDEYQDNTMLQDKIIECFEKPEGNVFRVGDIKQSIYKFRFAAPDNFLKRMKAYESKEKNGQTHYLKENHRSTCEVLAFSNYIFEQIMSEEASEIEYNESQKLSKATETKHGDIPRIIVADTSIEMSDDGDKTNEENRAIFAAVESEVRRYLETGRKLDGTRPECKDICIITATNNQSERIARYLNGCTLSDGRKIEASGRFTTDVFEDMDIHRLINFLICIGNEYRDEYVASVMLSNYKFSNFTVAELAEVQAFIHEMSGPSIERQPLMLRLRVFAEKSESELALRIKSFIDVFDRIRMSALVSDIDDIIELIYRETGIKATIEKRDGDSSKFDVFKDWLSQSFKRRGSDVTGIADSLEQMKIQIKKADIEVTDASKNKITTMTVHKSKGLEFPFVILVTVGGNSEQNDNLGSIMFDREVGFMTEDYDPDKITREHSFEQYVYKMLMDLKTNAEKCRLLYVALTRAEENLSIITCSNFADTTKANPIKNPFMSSIEYEKKSFDKKHWLIGDKKLPYCFFSALARSKDGAELRDAAGVADLKASNAIPFKDLDGNEVKGFEVVKLTRDVLSKLYEAHKTKDEPAEDKAEPEAKEKPQFDPDGKLILPEYKYQECIDIPFKVSVTGIAGNGKPSDTTHVDMEIRSVDDFASDNVSMLTAAAKGTILHRIMRFIDLEGIRSGSVSFELEIEALINDGYLNICSADKAREVAFEFRDGIEKFCKDPKCEAVISSFNEGTARSEKPIVFSVFIDGEGGDSALVQGIIDLIYKTEDGYTILDYKTDRIDAVSTEERADEAKKRHAFQLESYAAACEEDGMKIAHKLLYLVRYGEFVEV